MNNDQDKKNIKSRSWLFILPVILVLAWLLYYSVTGDSLLFRPSINRIEVDSSEVKKQKEKSDREFLKAVTITDTTFKIIHVSSPEVLHAGFDENAGKNFKMVFNGRRINIAIIGLDSRLGARTKHADANHILSIMLDSGTIEIISIPRDTPADAGLEDSTGQNKLTIVRAVRGIDAYLEEAANIAGLDKIHYYVEFGFSQAMGILDWLGYSDASSTLQFLRSRTGLSGDDYQRCYNQAQFIKQAILKHIGKTSGILGDVIIRGGLALVETNLNYTTSNNIINMLKAKGFPKSSDDLKIYVRPPVPIKFKVYDFSDAEMLARVRNQIENWNKDNFFSDSVKSVSFSVARKLNTILRTAVQDTSKRPQNVINNLQVYFDQRAWMQVRDTSERHRIRDEFGALLFAAYNKKSQPQKAAHVRNIIESERSLFKYSQPRIGH